MIRLQGNKVNENWTLENYVCFCKKNLTEE